MSIESTLNSLASVTMAAPRPNSHLIKSNVYRKCNVTNATKNSAKENVVIVRGVSYRCNQNGSWTKIATPQQLKIWKEREPFDHNPVRGSSPHFPFAGRPAALQTSKRYSKVNDSLKLPSSLQPKQIKARFRLITRLPKPRSAAIPKRSLTASVGQSNSASKLVPIQSRYKWVRGAQVFKKIFVQAVKTAPRPSNQETVICQLGAKALKSSIDRLRRKSKQKLATNNQKYCMYFCRFGRCNKGSTCPFKHDPEKVAVCTRYVALNLHPDLFYSFFDCFTSVRIFFSFEYYLSTRFLRGTCRIDNCTFSHNLTADKMPVCSFFLKRACTKDPCPYRHVKVAESATVCPDFNRGHCPKGDQVRCN